MSVDPSTLPRLFEKFIAFIPHAREAGISYRGHGEGWAEAELAWSEKLVAYADGGTIASGAVFTLMDTIAGLSVVATLGKMTPVATLDLRLDYLRPATSGATIVGRSECFKLTRSVAFVRGLAHEGDPGHPVAHMTGTFMFTAGASV